MKDESKIKQLINKYKNRIEEIEEDFNVDKDGIFYPNANYTLNEQEDIEKEYWLLKKIVKELEE